MRVMVEISFPSSPVASITARSKYREPVVSVNLRQRAISAESRFVVSFPRVYPLDKFATKALSMIPRTAACSEKFSPPLLPRTGLTDKCEWCLTDLSDLCDLTFPFDSTTRRRKGERNLAKFTRLLGIGIPSRTGSDTYARLR